MTCCPFDILPDTEQELNKNWKLFEIVLKIEQIVLK